MGGENNNALGFIKTMIDNVLENENFKRGSGRQRQGAWGHRFIPTQTVSCASQAIIEAINPPALTKRRFAKDPNHSSDIVGFKTIRFFNKASTLQHERDLVNFLELNFPCSRVIVNMNSDEDGQAKSVMRNFHRSEGTKQERKRYIRKMNAQMKRLAESLGKERSFLLDKKEWTKNITILNEAVSWLGFDASCHFQYLMEFNTKGYKHTNNTMPKLGAKCNALI